ncbi:MAG: ABC transporter substrate-binding protein [Alphaproteobacteria bacterium]|nr:ABC transporter substrate-binding protein [Alphaproteobacteria bacterium]
MKYLKPLILISLIQLSSSLNAEDVPSPTEPPTIPTTPQPTHGIAIFGDLKYPANFDHFAYVNPDAPKGGVVKMASFGSYDTFNPFIIKGNAAAGASSLHCTLLAPSGDEPMSFYGYLAEKVELAPDRKSEIFTLNKNAKFSDGTPVTADDVIFSFQTLMKKGQPVYAQYYKDVKNVEKINDHQVKFTFATDKNRELPVILGQLVVFSKAYYTKHDFEKADLTPPVGCGPYKIVSFKAGQSVNYERVPGWWAANLPSQKGENNFDITFIYYRDQNVLFEAFKSGDHDFRSENIAKNWATGYKIPAVTAGKIVLKEAEDRMPKGMQMNVLNMRRPLFQDRKVREALAKAFDFEWANKNLFFNSYVRTHSFFSNSPMASSGLPQGEELKILEPFKDQLPAEVFTKEFTLPVTNGAGNDRKVLAESDKLLKEAGWIVKDGKRVNEKTGEPFTFEFLLSDPAYERVALALQRNLTPLGIVMTTRTVTPSQYIERVQNYEYDMITFIFAESETPGNEQRFYWNSKEADVKNGYNFSGIKNPIVDHLIELVITSPDRQTLETRVHALDRVLLWQFLGIPEYHANKSRIAYWNKFGQPKIKPKDGVGFSTWWVDPVLEKKLGR